MTCQQTVESLSLYLDGELAAARQREVAAHLQECCACREELESLRLSSELLGLLSSPSLAVDLAPRIVARAAVPTWRQRGQTARAFFLPKQSFLVRQLIRATAVAALFALAVNLPGRGPSGLFNSLPAHVAAAPTVGMAYLTTGIVRVQAFFGELVSPSTHRISGREQRHSSLTERPMFRIF